VCGIAVAIDSLGDISLAFSDDFCDSLFHSKCLSICSDIVLCKCMILYWNSHFEAFLSFQTESSHSEYASCEPSDCRPGDVYALAKTLWVLSTGQRYPIPGNLSSYEEASQLSAYVHHQRAVLLDRLLDLATDLNPKQRPTCSYFAEELDAWLNEKQNASSIVTIPETTSARLQRLTEVSERARQEQGMAFEETQQILINIHGELVKMGEQIAQAAGTNCNSQRLPNGNTNISLHFFPSSKDEGRRPGGNRCFEENFRTVTGKTITVKGCVVLETIPPSTGVIKGGLVIAANHRPTEYILKRELRFRFASAVQERTVSQFLSDMQSNLPILADRLAEVLREENTISSREKPEDLNG